LFRKSQDISELLTRLEIENEEQEARFKPKVPATLPPDELQLVSPQPFLRVSYESSLITAR
jgi:hypothetical protein